MDSEITEPEAISPEDAEALAETAFERSGSYEFNGVPLTFSYEHEAASVRLAFAFNSGDVADFLYLLSLPGKEAARLRTPAQKDAFFESAAAWGRAQGVRVGTLTIQRASEVAVHILEDWRASLSDPIPDPEAKPTKN